MSLPEAHIVHRTSKRLRIKIPAKKGDASFFQRMRSELGGARVLSVNAVTGSALLSETGLEVQEIADLGARKRLFALAPLETPLPVASKMVGPLKGLNERIGRLSGLRLDLAGILAMFFLAFGLFELMRGNLRSPPWYTAFWYAFGLLSKSLSDARHGAGEE